MGRPHDALRRAQRGLSLIEVVIVITVLAIAIPPLTGLYREVAQASVDDSQQQAALDLAQALMEEITSKAFEDAEADTGSFGTEEGDRADYDDVDDYDGWSQSPPERIDGTELSAFSGLTRSVTVENVTTGDPDAETAEADGSTPLKRIQVQVSWSGGRGGAVTLTTLRASLVQEASGDLIDQDPSAASAYPHDDDHFHIDLHSLSESDLEIASFELSADLSTPDLKEIKLDNAKILDNATVSLPTGVTALNDGSSSDRTMEALEDSEARIKFHDDFDDGDVTTFTLVLHFTDGSSDDVVFTIDWDDD